jgi:hypothetical protein
MAISLGIRGYTKIMANLGEDFRHAAQELKKAALEFVAHAFNSASEKDMTAIAALKTPKADSHEEAHPDETLKMSRFSDELFSAVKHGNEARVRELLDLDDSPENNKGPGMVNLMEAVHEKKADDYMEQLIEIATESGDYDLSMAALLLVASGGNPEAAREMLKDYTEGKEGVGNYSEAALEHAIAKGNLSGAAIIKQRMRAIEFNAKAGSEKQKESLYDKCMKFFTGKSAADTAAENSRFVAPTTGEEKDIDFVNNLTPAEQVTFTAKMIKSLSSILSWGPKAN